MVADVEHGTIVDQAQAADLVKRREGIQPHPVTQLAAGQGAAVGQHPGLGDTLLLADPLVEMGMDGGIIGESGRCHEPAAPLSPVDKAIRFEAGERLLDGDAGGGEALAQGPFGGQLLPRRQLAAADIAAQGLANLFTLGGAPACGHTLLAQSQLSHCHIPWSFRFVHRWSRPASIGPEL
ncbi:hypothetical protein BHG40_05970 [Aeromonas salmonicida subsp. masoucida]|nr:hypothetical protein BHG40_05970 [Aeromonas salmonicida subsp. masoucida]GAJ49223.1 hypothetical protein ASA01S_042_00150 [Aeromonas salmonicida subsp. masoucida NBRC 13784]